MVMQPRNCQDNLVNVIHTHCRKALSTVCSRKIIHDFSACQCRHLVRLNSLYCEYSHGPGPNFANQASTVVLYDEIPVLNEARVLPRYVANLQPSKVSKAAHGVSHLAVMVLMCHTLEVCAVLQMCHVR